MASRRRGSLRGSNQAGRCWFGFDIDRDDALNDGVSGLKWVHANAEKLGIDTRRVIVAGESGGGNPTLATGMKLLKEGDIDLVQGLYALCPYITGGWPLPQNPSSIENEGIVISVHHNRGAMGKALRHSVHATRWPGRALPRPRTSKAGRR
jgi:hypothetical protein